MGEYLDRESVLEILDGFLKAHEKILDAPPQCNLVYHAMRKLPVANVAPRSEVALEIIGEIWASHTPDIDGFFTMHETELVNLKKKYVEERAVPLSDKLADASARSTESGRGAVDSSEYVKEQC